jgi:hypothetical protein
LQAARVFQHGPAFAGVRRRRQAAEHRLARLVQLGIRQARYVGRQKTLFQLLLAATVANLTLLASLANDALATTTAAAAAVVALVLAFQPHSAARALFVRRRPSSDGPPRGHLIAVPRLVPPLQLAGFRPHF